MQADLQQRLSEFLAKSKSKGARDLLQEVQSAPPPSLSSDLPYLVVYSVGDQGVIKNIRADGQPGWLVAKYEGLVNYISQNVEGGQPVAIVNVLRLFEL